MKRLRASHIRMLHQMLIQETGGLDGIRDEGLLDSALNAPFQTFDGEDLYASIAEKAARLCYSLIRNHPFADGNKRIGILAMLVFLELNHHIVVCVDEELVEVGTSLAAGTKDYASLLVWLSQHVRKYDN